MEELELWRSFSFGFQLPKDSRILLTNLDELSPDFGLKLQQQWGLIIILVADCLDLLSSMTLQIDKVGHVEVIPNPQLLPWSIMCYVLFFNFLPCHYLSWISAVLLVSVDEEDVVGRRLGQLKKDFGCRCLFFAFNGTSMSFLIQTSAFAAVRYVCEPIVGTSNSVRKSLHPVCHCDESPNLSFQVLESRETYKKLNEPKSRDSLTLLNDHIDPLSQF